MSLTLFPPSTSGGSASWGGITGTLSAQTDLQTALDAKAGLVSNTFSGTQNAVHYRTDGSSNTGGLDCYSGATRVAFFANAFGAGVLRLNSTGVISFASDSDANNLDSVIRRHAAGVIGIDTNVSGTPPILLDGGTGAITATSLNGAVIGGVTPAAGTFSTVQVSDYVITSGLGYFNRQNSGVYALGGSDDVVITRDDEDALALRRNMHAQTFNIYNTYTDGSNYERGSLYWTADTLYLQTGAAGTGTRRSIIVSAGTASVGLEANTLNFRDGSGATNWQINSSGTLLASAGIHLQLGNAYAAGVIVADGSLIIKDSTGTSYKIPCVAA